MNASRIFVTGGAGFIGSALVDRLVADGAQVTAYDNLSLGRHVSPNHTAHDGLRSATWATDQSGITLRV